MSAAYPYANCWECLLVLAVGTGVTVALAALVARAVPRAVWQRTIWQVTTAALLILLALEWTGIYPVVAMLCGPGRSPLGPASPRSSQGDAPGGALSPLASREVGAASPLRPPEAKSVSVHSTRVREDSPRPLAAGTTKWSGQGVRAGASAAASQSALHAALPQPELPIAHSHTLAGLPNQHAMGSPPASSAQGDDASPPSTVALQAVAVGEPSTCQSGFLAALLRAGGGCAAWLAWIWAAGTGLLLVRLAWVHSLVGRFRRRQPPASDPGLRRRVELLSRRLGLRRAVALLESPELGSPVTLGIFRPTVILSAGFCRSFEPRQQEAMLAHELAHLAAWDPVWSLLADLAAAQLWWHPLVWWARGRLRAANEAAADEASALVPGGPDALAASLVAMGRRLATPGMAWLSVDGGGFRSGLGRRVQRLIDLASHCRQAPARRRLVMSGTALVMVLILVSTWCTAWAVPQANFPPGGTTMNVLRSSWRQSLAAAVLAAVLAPSSTLGAEGERPKEPPPKPAIKEEVRRPPEEGRVRELMEKRRHLEEQAMEIRRKLDSLKPDQDADAKELQAKLRQIEAHLRELPPPPGRRGPEREQIERRIAELQEALRRAKEAGNQEEVERIMREGRELRQALAGREGRRPEGPPEGRERLERRMAELREALQRAKEAGNREEVERLMREARELQQAVAGREGRRPEGTPEGRERLERRMAELREALQRAKEAGNREEMERIQREVRELQQAAAGREGRRPERPPEGREGPPRPRGEREGPAPERREGPPPERLQRVIEEMRTEMNEMRRQMQELREALKRLAEERREK